MNNVCYLSAMDAVILIKILNEKLIIFKFFILVLRQMASSIIFYELVTIYFNGGF